MADIGYARVSAGGQERPVDADGHAQEALTGYDEFR